MSKQSTKVRVPRAATIMRGIKTPEGFERQETTDTWTPWGGRERTFPVLTLTSPDVEIRVEFSGGRDSYELATGHVTFDTAMGKRTFDRYGIEDSFYVSNPAEWDSSNMFHGERVVLGSRLGTITSTPGYREWGEKRKDSWADEYVVAWDDGETLTYTDRQFKRAGVKRAGPVEQANETIRRVIEERIPEARERLARSEQVPTIPFSVTPEEKARVTEALLNEQRYSFTPGGMGVGYELNASRIWSDSKRSSELARFFGVPEVWVSTFDAD